ncbi:MAG: GNAT family N-acetyltransferase [Chloroflexi bacterium]|nr:GNAT family N-acetyltransferase [Chloroflexota bacterium]
MLTGAKVILNTVERADLTANYRWGNDRELIRLSGMHPYPRSGWEIEKWFQTMNTNPTSRLFAIRTGDGRYIGNIELSNIDARCGGAEVGLVIGEKGERCKGYGRDAILTIVKFAFDEMRLHRVFARVLEFNEAAVKCFKSCGFREEGRERQAFFSGGVYNDVIIFGIIENEFPG